MADLASKRFHSVVIRNLLEFNFATKLRIFQNNFQKSNLNFRSLPNFTKKIFSEMFGKILTKCRAVHLFGIVLARSFFPPVFDYGFQKLCKGVQMHCIDLGESFQTHIYLQNLASIQSRTPPVPSVFEDNPVYRHRRRERAS